MIRNTYGSELGGAESDARSQPSDNNIEMAA
jgi:hypothetical protein